MESKVVSVRLTDRQRAALKTEALRLEVAAAEVIRRVLDQWCDAQLEKQKL